MAKEQDGKTGGPDVGIIINSKSLLKKSFPAGWSKMPECKAPETLRSEAYLNVRRNDEG